MALSIWIRLVIFNWHGEGYFCPVANKRNKGNDNLLGIDELFANVYTCAFLWFHNLGSCRETHGFLSLDVPNRGCCCHYTNSDCGFSIVVIEDMIILIILLIIIIIMIRIIISKPVEESPTGLFSGIL